MISTVASPMLSSSEGRIVGTAVHYRIEDPIATGAFSKVYRCRELTSGAVYAIKVIDKKLATKKRMTEALIREVNALEAAGSSPFVISLVDKMVSQHNYYLVMSLAEGGTLLDLIREERQTMRAAMGDESLTTRTATTTTTTAVVPADRARLLGYTKVQRYMKQLLLGLHHLHEHNVVHRDIKPENIILNRRQTRLFISDFGFACYAVPGQKLHRACGTLKYCAPELLRARPSYDGRKVDVWAAGVTLYVLLFGGYPFRLDRAHSNDPDALLRQMEAAATSASSSLSSSSFFPMPKAIPAAAEDFLKHMLCFDAEGRWSTGQLLEHAWLREVAVGQRRAPSSVGSTSGLPGEGNRSASSWVLETLPTTTGESGSSPSGTPCPPPSIPSSEFFPPIDAIDSEDDDVDDGFYNASFYGTASSSSPSQSQHSSPLHRHSTTAWRRGEGAMTSSEDSQTTSPGLPKPMLDKPCYATPNREDRDIVLSRFPSRASELNSPCLSANTAAFTPHSTKSEILAAGKVSTLMTSIQSPMGSARGHSESDYDFCSEEDVDEEDDVLEEEEENDVKGWQSVSSTVAGTSEEMEEEALQSRLSSRGAQTTPHTVYRREDDHTEPSSFSLVLPVLLTGRSLILLLWQWTLLLVCLVARLALHKDVTQLPLPDFILAWIRLSLFPEQYLYESASAAPLPSAMTHPLSSHETRRHPDGAKEAGEALRGRVAGSGVRRGLRSVQGALRRATVSLCYEDKATADPRGGRFSRSSSQSSSASSSRRDGAKKMLKRKSNQRNSKNTSHLEDPWHPVHAVSSASSPPPPLLPCSIKEVREMNRSGSAGPSKSDSGKDTPMSSTAFSPSVPMPMRADGGGAEDFPVTTTHRAGASV